MSRRKHKYGKRLVWILALVLALFLSLVCGMFRSVPVLMYHYISDDGEAPKEQLAISKHVFEKQLRLLKSWGFRVYSLDEYYAIKTGKLKLPQKGVVITFDDGRRDFYDIVYPILIKENVPAANFLIWNNLSKQERGGMSAAEAKTLLKSPLVTFGVHTVSHRVLVGLSDAELEEEVVEAKHELERALGIPLFYFAYPSGYFDNRAIQKVRETGYRLAFTTSRRRLEARPETLHSLIRVKITEKDANPIHFWFKVSGFYSLSKKIKWTVVNHMFPAETPIPADQII